MSTKNFEHLARARIFVMQVARLFTIRVQGLRDCVANKESAARAKKVGAEILRESGNKFQARSSDSCAKTKWDLRRSLRA